MSKLWNLGGQTKRKKERKKQFPTVNRVNMFSSKRYNNQERPNTSNGKVLATCVAILDEQPNIIRSINEMLRMSVNRNYIRAKNREAYDF